MKKTMLFAAGVIVSIMALSCGNNNNDTNSGGSEQATECAQLTAKGKDACVSDAIKGKECSWQQDLCIEFSTALKDFQASARTFAVPIHTDIDSKKDNALGTDHGETIDWKTLCQMAGEDHSLRNNVKSIELDFKEKSNSVNIVLDCTEGGGKNDVTYKFAYQPTTKEEGDLLLTLVPAQDAVEGNFVRAVNFGEGDPRNKPAIKGNLLDFFSKAGWFYFKDRKQVIGISLLANVGRREGDPVIDFKEGKDFDDAIAYARKPSGSKGAGGGGYEVGYQDGKDIGAISFVFDAK